MSVKYHISKTAGPAVCRAKIKCRLGADAPHFDSKEEAQKYYEKQLAGDNPFASASKKKKQNSINSPVYQKTSENSRGQVIYSKVKDKKFTPELFELNEKLEESSFEDIQDYANSSESNFSRMSELIEARASHAYKTNEAIEKLNPKKAESNSKITQKTFAGMKRDLSSYRNHTAMMVEAQINSRFYESKVKDMGAAEYLGSARIVTSYSHSEDEWHLSRYNSIGGSEVGALVLKDYADVDNLKSLDKLYMKKVLDSKEGAPPTVESARKAIAMSETSRRGALYIGTIWEDKIRDEFAEDHPEYKVYNNKNQYQVEGKDWYKINVDGVLSDRADGKPNGILEIKTGSDLEKWDKGVPDNYRAQVLYYLNATKMDYAVVRASLMDAQVKDYRFEKTDEVYPGSGINMEDYVNSRVEPWFTEVKKKRKIN